MQKLKFEFRPSWLGIIMTALAVTVFTALAVWQLSRADERNLLREQVLSRSQLPVKQYDAAKIDFNKDRYRRFMISGKFHESGQVLLDNVVRHGKPGYSILTPFSTNQGAKVMVDRGWIPAGRSRDQVPDAVIETGQQELLVMLDQFRSAPVIGVEARADKGRWNYMDLDLYNGTTGLNVPAYVLRLSPESNIGYEKAWPEIEDKSGMHIGYAIHWAAFALIALGTFLGLSFKRKTS